MMMMMMMMMISCIVVWMFRLCSFPCPRRSKREEIQLYSLGLTEPGGRSPVAAWLQGSRHKECQARAEPDER